MLQKRIQAFARVFTKAWKIKLLKKRSHVALLPQVALLHKDRSGRLGKM